MLTLRTSLEFADWFAGLDQPAAESVAATLEVITQLGPETDAPGSSDWLTWYEHPSVPQRLSLVAHPASSAARAMGARFVREWGAFNGYVRRVIAHLESPTFMARLKQLDADALASVTAVVVRIKKARVTRALAVSEQYGKVWGPGGARAEASLFALADVSEIREAYFAALAAAGFEPKDVASSSPALREIGLRSPAPGLRLLYGVDRRRRRGLVVLGERFDRSFYGDSVRFAEQRWREFLEDESEERASR